MSATAENLKVIDRALVIHSEKCGDTVRFIEMNPFEVERLGWDEYKGIEIRASEAMGTGRFRLVCDAMLGNGDNELATEAVAEREAHV